MTRQNPSGIGDILTLAALGFGAYYVYTHYIAAPSGNTGIVPPSSPSGGSVLSQTPTGTSSTNPLSSSGYETPVAPSAGVPYSPVTNLQYQFGGGGPITATPINAGTQILSIAPVGSATPVNNLLPAVMPGSSFISYGGLKGLSGGYRYRMSRWAA